MVRMLIGFIAVVAAVSAFARTPYQRIKYDIVLSAVERTGADGTTRSDQPEANTYEDDRLRIEWTAEDVQLNFTLTNKATGTMRIQWDGSSYVGPSGETEVLVHTTAQFGNTSAPQPATSVIRGAVVKAFVKPASTIRWQETPARGWFMDRLIQVPNATRNVDELRKQLPEAPRVIRVLLPVEVAGQSTEYLFEFSAKASIVPLE